MRMIVDLPEPDATYLRTQMARYALLLRSMREEAQRHNNHTQRYRLIEREADDAAGDIADLLTGGTVQWEAEQ